jgi:hypothetical protein
MRKYLPCLAVLVGMAVASSPAAADPNVGPKICPSAGQALSGSVVGNLTITGDAYVPAGSTLTVRGNLTLAAGSCFDAFTVATVVVKGAVNVGKGAVLGLGCSPGAIGPEPPCEFNTTEDIVGGGISAREPLTMYLTAVKVFGNVISIGGGPGPTLNPYINFPIKENTISRNLDIQGWRGAWFGVLRNTIHGSATILNNVGVTIGDLGTPDSTEIVTNTIWGSLACYGNSPTAQFGDSGGAPNVVHGQTSGQCDAV